MESCLTQANAAAAGSATEQQIQSACECGAEASDHGLKDVPLTEQYSRLEEPDMQKIGTIMQTCMQNAGL